MKTSILLTIAAGMLMISCDLLSDNPEQGRSSRDGRQPSIRTDSTTTAVDSTQADVIKKSIYISAIEQSQDTCNIILFKDNKRILTLKAGSDEEIGTGTDQHHIVGGHLFTEYIDREGTVIKKDGKPYYCCPEIESTKGILSSGSDVYILGQNTSGDGFSLWKNRERMFHSEVGRVWGDLLESASHPSGALYSDKGSICFCYYISSLDTESQTELRQWFIVKDGIQTLITLPNNITEVHDIKVIDGQICIVATKGNDTYPVLLINGETFVLQNSSVNSLKDFKLTMYENKVAFHGTILSGSRYKTGIWTKDGLMTSYDGRNDIILEHKGYNAYINFSEEGAISIFSPWGKSCSMEGPFHYITCRNVAIDEIRIHLIANPLDEDMKPFVWNDGEISEVRGNLFLTSISIE